MMISFREKFGCVSSGRDGGSSILRYLQNVYLRYWPFPVDVCHMNHYFLGVGWILLIFRLEILLLFYTTV